MKVFRYLLVSMLSLLTLSAAASSHYKAAPYRVTKVKKWWHTMRTPLGLIPEGDDIYTIVYAAVNNDMRFHPMGMVQVKLNREVLDEITKNL